MFKMPASTIECCFVPLGGVHFEHVDFGGLISPRTCAGIAIESRVGDIEDDTHEVRIEGGPLIFQRKNYIKVGYSGG